MRSIAKILSLLLSVFMLAGCLAACNGDPAVEPDEHIDYAASVKLDMSSSSLKQAATVKMYIDGDTTHFYVPESVAEGGVLKARYLAIDTPESTGKIEAWGKTASNFTKEKLSTATSIILESDDSKWNVDSTGSRHLVWVWYKPEGSDEYRNLNIEILQNGLAIASNSGQNRYGETCLKAIAQAEKEQLCVYSKQNDPNFYYGEAVELTLKELRCNIAEYDGVKVAFTGVVTKNSGNDGVYVESLDEETGVYFGMYVYYGKSASGDVIDMLSIGNEVRVVGNVSQFNGSYQVSGLTYRKMKPNDPSNTQKLSENNTAAYTLTPADLFVNGKVNVMVGEEEKTFDYAELALGSTIKMEGLVVKSMYTTDDPESSSRGAISLTCEVDGVTVELRTTVLYKDGQIVTESYFEGKTIDVRGIVDCYNGDYQIKILSINDVDIK